MNRVGARPRRPRRGHRREKPGGRGRPGWAHGTAPSRRSMCTRTNNARRRATVNGRWKSGPETPAANGSARPVAAENAPLAFRRSPQSTRLRAAVQYRKAAYRRSRGAFMDGRRTRRQDAFPGSGPPGTRQATARADSRHRSTTRYRPLSQRSTRGKSRAPRLRRRHTVQ